MLYICIQTFLQKFKADFNRRWYTSLFTCTCTNKYIQYTNWIIARRTFIKKNDTINCQNMTNIDSSIFFFHILGRSWVMLSVIADNITLFLIIRELIPVMKRRPGNSLLSCHNFLWSNLQSNLYKCDEIEKYQLLSSCFVVKWWKSESNFL